MRYPQWSTDRLPDLTSHTFLITGSTSGIGTATAQALSGAGATIIHAVRSRGKAEKLAQSLGDTPLVVEVDFSSLDSVKASVSQLDELVSTHGLTINSLINNAGMICPNYQTSADGFELTYATNALGPFAFTNLVAPLITDRIVIVGSVAHLTATLNLHDVNFTHRRYHRMDAYGQSKLMNMVWAHELQRRLDEAGHGAVVQTAHPGYTSSNISSGLLPGKAGELLNKYTEPLGQTPAKGALPTLFAAVEDLPALSYIGPHGRGGLKGWPSFATKRPDTADKVTGGLLWRTMVNHSGTDLTL